MRICATYIMCLSGQDQTERRQQRWKILAPRVRQNLALPREGFRHRSAPKSLLFNEETDLDLWSKLAKPAKQVRYLQNREQSPQAVQRAKLSPFESIPAELLSMVLGQSGLAKRDLIALALSSDVLSSHVLHHIESESKTSKAPWAGHELACIGTYLTDLPEAFETGNLFHSSVNDYGGPVIPCGNMCLARAINHATDDVYKLVPNDAEVEWRAVFDEHASLMVSSLEYDRLFRLKTAILEILASRWSCTSDSAWMLRNLTTKQYVRCRPTKPGGAQTGYVDHVRTRTNPLRVDHVLLMYICWTVMRGVRDDPNGMGIFRGVWAGHCFDIVSQQEVDMTREAWEDVTDDIVTEAARLRGVIKMPEHRGLFTQQRHSHVAWTSKKLVRV